MTETPEPPTTSTADVAAEPAEQSVAHEQKAVGGQPDTGGTGPTDDVR